MNVSRNVSNTFPNVSTVEQIRDYLDWVVETGRGDYRLEIREHYLACVPKSDDRFDEKNRVAFLVGVY